MKKLNEKCRKYIMNYERIKLLIIGGNMGVELNKMMFYVNDDVKTFEDVLKIIGQNEKGKNFNKVKDIEELNKVLEAFNKKNNSKYKITLVYPTLVEYDNKKILFYSERAVKKYFENNYPNFYKENKEYIRDFYDLVKLGIKVKEIQNAEFEKKRINFKCNEKSKEIER